jgi:hypothetical protein
MQTTAKPSLSLETSHAQTADHRKSRKKRPSERSGSNDGEGERDHICMHNPPFMATST